MLPFSATTSSSHLTVLISVVAVLFVLLCILTTRLMQLINRRLCADLQRHESLITNLRSYGVMRFNSRESGNRARRTVDRSFPQVHFPVTISSFIEHDPDKDSVCPICLECFAATPVSTGPCAHKIHTACLIDWLVKDRSQSCPICRAPYTSNTPDILNSQRADMQAPSNESRNVLNVVVSEAVNPAAGGIQNSLYAGTDNRVDNASQVATVCSSGRDSRRDSIPSVEAVPNTPAQSQQSHLPNLSPNVMSSRTHCRAPCEVSLRIQGKE